MPRRGEEGSRMGFAFQYQQSGDRPSWMKNNWQWASQWLGVILGEWKAGECWHVKLTCLLPNHNREQKIKKRRETVLCLMWAKGQKSQEWQNQER